MNWLLVIVLVIFLICTLYGGIKGLFKIGVCLVASILTVILMVYLTPHVGKAVEKYTPLDEMVEQKCVKIFMPDLPAFLEGRDLKETPLAGVNIAELKAMKQVDWERMGLTVKDILDTVGEIPEEVQLELVESSAFPDFLKQLILKNNNDTVYEKLEVTSFTEYAAGYMSRLVVKLVSFLVSFLFAIVIVLALIAAVDIIGEFPLIGPVNHISGAVLGIIMAILVVWVIFLAVTVLYSTPVGQICFEMIQKSKFLTFLYTNNILLSSLLSF